MKTVGIIGYGVVGKAHEFAFEKDCLVLINDPMHEAMPHHRTKEQLVEACDVIFVCVPTPYNTSTESPEYGPMLDVFTELGTEIAGSDKKPLIAIKSAIPPRLVSELYALGDFRLVVNPEYLSERNSVADLIAQETLIVGGAPEDRKELIDLFMNHSRCNKAAKVGETGAVEAALIKYMENAFLAVKVIFMNEMKQVHDKLVGATDDKAFNEVIKVHQLDSRMGGTYPAIIPGPDGHLGFGGKCLPKDMLTIISQAQEMGISLDLLKAAWLKNLEVREDRNWEVITGAVM